MRELPIPKTAGMAGRQQVLDDMREALRSGRKPRHDGAWGKATLEVALAVQRSAREGREVALDHQVAVDDRPR
jgi:phthalate 4,5-cis-dihydrodiol dehydrogenase